MGGRSLPNKLAIIPKHQEESIKRSLSMTLFIIQSIRRSGRPVPSSLLSTIMTLWSYQAPPLTSSKRGWYRTVRTSIIIAATTPITDITESYQQTVTSWSIRFAEQDWARFIAYAHHTCTPGSETAILPSTLAKALFWRLFFGV